MNSTKKEKAKKLAIGVSGILIIYWIGGLFHEKLINGTYLNSQTNERQKCPYRLALIIFPSLFTWLAGTLIIKKTVTNPVTIPQKDSFMCGFIVFVSTFTYTIAAAMTSFPIVMAFKASNILAVLLIAIFCTRVKDKKLNLSPSKIKVGFVIFIGAFMFGFFDPQIKGRSNQSQFMGIFMLLISLLADGFLPDFQAQIKSKYKPEPTQMMTEINKYICLITFTFTLYKLQILDILSFMSSHPEFLINLLFLSLSTLFGQLLIYKVIKQFKQHIVPFIVTIRKIFTVLINVMYFGHKASWLQMLGMVVIVVAVVYEFRSEVEEREDYSQILKNSDQLPEMFQANMEELQDGDRDNQ